MRFQRKWLVQKEHHEKKLNEREKGSLKQPKRVQRLQKVRSGAPEARYVAPWSCPVPPEAGVVTVAGTVAAVAGAVAGVGDSCSGTGSKSLP